MPIANRKEADDVLALVRVVAPSERVGIGLSTLISRVSIDSTRVESLMQKHTEYFVRIGSEQQYALNRFGKFEGSAERIIVDVERSYKLSKRGKIAFLIVLIILIFSGSLVSNTA